MQDTVIVHVRGRSVWDSRGRPTVEVEIAAGSVRGSSKVGGLAGDNGGFINAFAITAP